MEAGNTKTRFDMEQEIMQAWRFWLLAGPVLFAEVNWFH